MSPKTIVYVALCGPTILAGEASASPPLAHPGLPPLKLLDVKADPAGLTDEGQARKVVLADGTVQH